MNNLTNHNKQFNLMAASYGDIRGLKYDYAVLPWGATEPHNFHLPYITDAYLAHNIAVDAVTEAYDQEDIKGMVLPPVYLGSQSLGQRDLPFCIHTRYETQKAILTDIVDSLNVQGIKILVIINGHSGNSFKSMIRDLSIDYPDFLIVTTEWYSVLDQTDFKGEQMEHAGELETSVMMYYYPNLVDVSLAKESPIKNFKSKSLQEGVAWVPRVWPKISGNMGVSKTLNSSEEKGRNYADAVSQKLVELFVDLVRGDIY